MLQSKVAQIHDLQPFLLEPSSRIENISEQWLDQLHDSPRLGINLGNSPRPLSPSESSCRSQRDSMEAQEIRKTVVEDVQPTSGFQQPSQRLSWMSNIGEELTTALSKSADLHEHLESFDGAYNSFQHFDSLEPL